MSEQDKLQGEGNYDAARNYRRGVEKHIQDHDVTQEARDAKPGDAAEARDMESAEQAGKRRAKGEDSRPAASIRNREGSR